MKGMCTEMLAERAVNTPLMSHKSLIHCLLAHLQSQCSQIKARFTASGTFCWLVPIVFSLLVQYDSVTHGRGPGCGSHSLQEDSCLFISSLFLCCSSFLPSFPPQPSSKVSCAGHNFCLKPPKLSCSASTALSTSMEKSPQPQSASGKRSYDEAFGRSEASEGKKPKTGERSDPHPSFPVSCQDGQICETAAFWREKAIKNGQLAEAWRDQTIKLQACVNAILAALQAGQLQIVQQNQATAHLLPPPQSESPVRPAPAAGPAVIDLTGDDKQPTWRSPGKGAELRRAFRAKSYAFLGERNHMKKGYVAPPLWEHDVRRAREQTGRNRRTSSARAASGCSASRADPAQETEAFDEFADSFEAVLQEDA